VKILLKPKKGVKEQISKKGNEQGGQLSKGKAMQQKQKGEKYRLNN